MDFMNRGASQQPAHNNRPTNEQATEFSPSPVSLKKDGGKLHKFFKFGSFTLLILIALLIVAVLVAITTGNTNRSDNEVKLVQSSQLQAVFLTNGQVYFGNINNINTNYINLSNIYYLTTNTAVQPSTGAANSNANVQLVKLGCELHAPYDQMTINRSQVTFWENLKSDGQVAKAVAQYKTANPNGQSCTTASTTPKQ